MLTRKMTSLQHPHIKHLVKLRENRDYRYRSQSVVICGFKLISELARQFHFYSLILEEGIDVEFEFTTQNLYFATPKMIKKISGLEQPEPILAEIPMPKAQEISFANFLLILDGISDPGNLGTLLRSARGLGWDAVFLTPGSTDPFNDKALRAAKGATFTMPWRTGTLEELSVLIKNKNMKLFAADAKGTDLSTFHFTQPLALALGNESHGLNSKLKEISEWIAIPMEKQMESLNVSSAGAILMYELRKSGQGPENLLRTQEV
jgi:TrmH family RNA methyltransferase